METTTCLILALSLTIPWQVWHGSDVVPVSTSTWHVYQTIILLCCDGAAWHKSGGLELPENIVLFHNPPYTPEMNPIEQIWKEIRKRGFRNQVFSTLQKVVDRLCDTIRSLSEQVISSITGRQWIIELFH